MEEFLPSKYPLSAHLDKPWISDTLGYNLMLSYFVLWPFSVNSHITVAFTHHFVFIVAAFTHHLLVYSVLLYFMTLQGSGSPYKFLVPVLGSSFLQVGTVSFIRKWYSKPRSATEGSFINVHKNLLSFLSTNSSLQPVF